MLEVEDAFCASNSGRYAINAHAEGISVTTTEADAHLVCTIEGLAQVLSGAVRAEVAARLGLMRGAHEDLTALGQLITHPPHMPLSDYF